MDSFEDYEDSNDNDYSEEEIYSNEDIVNIGKRDIRNNKIIVIGFYYRYNTNFNVELTIIINNYPQFKQLLHPLNTEQGGELKFKLDGDKVDVTIIPIDEFQYESSMSLSTEINLETFDLLCDLVKDIAVFMTNNGDTLLSSI